MSIVIGKSRNMSSMLSRKWPGYGAIWRWHFYASLFCIPFILWLACTGSIYLWKPQVEALLDRPYAHVADGQKLASPSAIAAAAVHAVPGSMLHHYQLPDVPGQAVQVLVGKGERETRVYVDPGNLKVLKAVDEDSRLMPTIFRMHGELLIGNKGSYIVELAASWAIVMILTGFALWWPRGGGVAGVVYPRLSLEGRRLWRDLHAVVGFWVSIFALGFLVSGLPWAASWGAYWNLRGPLRGLGWLPLTGVSELPRRCRSGRKMTLEQEQRSTGTPPIITEWRRTCPRQRSLRSIASFLL